MNIILGIYTIFILLKKIKGINKLNMSKVINMNTMLHLYEKYNF